MLSILKIEEVSQHFFIFDVLKVKEIRVSRRLVSFSMLPSSKMEDISQNCFVFKLEDRKVDR